MINIKYKIKKNKKTKKKKKKKKKFYGPITKTICSKTWFIQAFDFLTIVLASLAELVKATVLSTVEFEHSREFESRRTHFFFEKKRKKTRISKDAFFLR